MVRVLFKYLNTISQNQLGALFVMTVDGAVCALTTLFFETVASEICNVNLSFSSVQGQRWIMGSQGGTTTGKLCRAYREAGILLP